VAASPRRAGPRESSSTIGRGGQLATIQALVRYWATEHDWRACNDVDKGGHFAAWEEPDVFAEEVRAAFRALR
jgi:pimeloyl-ACP methyl ester carboxylesterase